MDGIEQDQHTSAATALATRPKAHSSGSPVRANPAETINHLSANLALVRPVGMSDDMAEEWLAVAATALADIPVDILADAAATARQECSHHGQIVPAIRKAAAEWMNLRYGRPFAEKNSIAAPVVDDERPAQIVDMSKHLASRWRG